MESEDKKRSSHKNQRFCFGISEELPKNSNSYAKVSLAIRKSLPQTSLMVGKSKFKSETLELNDFIGESLINSETEILELPNSIQVTVSKKLRILLTLLITKYPKCEIMQDMYHGVSDIYKYMYDKDFVRIKSLENLEETLTQVIISCRYKIDGKKLLFPALKTTKIIDCTSYQKINIYDSIIVDKKSKSLQKIHKSPLYVLKKKPSSHKFCNFSIKNEPNLINFKNFNGVIPSLSGQKVKQGAGGFKKPFLIYEKKPKIKNFFTNREKTIKNFTIPSDFLDKMIDLDEFCRNYSMTKQEFSRMLNDYTYLKGKSKYIELETITKAYSLNFEIFRGLFLDFSSKKTLNWKEFIKFYVLVLLRRSNFAENLEFIFNFLGITSVSQLNSLKTAFLQVKNSLFFENFAKISEILLNSDKTSENSSLLSQETIKLLKNEGITNYDLKMLLGLIITNN